MVSHILSPLFDMFIWRFGNIRHAAASLQMTLVLCRQINLARWQLRTGTQ